MWAITISIVGCTLISTSLVFGQSYNDNRHKSQYRSSQDAAILSDARYQSGDGTFGAAYSQEDGVEFKEESDANGDRKGSYSYVDPNGHRRTVYYTAGKNGFQASGDHIPTARPVIAPKPEYEPLPQFNPPEDYYTQPEPKYRARTYESTTPLPILPPQSHYLQESIYQPESIPEVQSPRYYSRDQRQYYRPSELPIATTTRPEYRYSEYRPIPSKQPQQYISEHRQLIPREEYRSREIYRNPQNLRNQRQFQSYSLTNDDSSGSEDYNDIITTSKIPVDISPRRFYPPGKLDFTRTPDGFSYTFTKN